MDVTKIIEVFRRNVSERYFDMNGSADLQEFWYFIAACVAVSIGAALIDAIVGARFFTSIVGLAILPPLAGIGARRLRDTGKDGSLVWIAIGPIALVRVIEMLASLSGTAGMLAFLPLMSLMSLASIATALYIGYLCAQPTTSNASHDAGVSTTPIPPQGDRSVNTIGAGVRENASGERQVDKGVELGRQVTPQPNASAHVEEQPDLTAEQRSLVTLAMSSVGGQLAGAERRTLRNALEGLVTASDPRGKEVVGLLAENGAEKSADIVLLMASDAEKSITPIETATPAARRVASKIWRDAGVVVLVWNPARAAYAFNRACVLDPEDPEAFNQTGLLQYRFGMFRIAENSLKNALEHAKGSIEREAAILANLGMLALSQGALAQAEDFSRRSLEIFERLGRADGESRALGDLGDISIKRGDTATAERLLKRALILAQEDGLGVEQAIILDHLGNAALVRGDFIGAETSYRRSLAIDERTGRRDGEAANFGNLGVVAKMRGDLPEAVSFHERALAIYEELGIETGIADNLHNLGMVHLAGPNVTSAVPFIQRALDINERLGRKEQLANQLGALGVIALKERDGMKAESYQQRSLAIFKEIGNREGEAMALHNLGDVAGGRGGFDVAKEYFMKAFEINEQLDRKSGQANNLSKLGQVARVQGQYFIATELHTRAIELNEQLGSKSALANEFFNLGLVAEEQENKAEQCRLWVRSRNLFREAGVAHEVEDVENKMRAAGFEHAL